MLIDMQKTLPPLQASPELAARMIVDDVYAYEFPPVPGVDIGTAYRPAADLSRVGGDLIDVYQFNNGSVAISIADISGKGTHAARRAALVKYALRAYVSAGLTPAQVMRNLNILYMETSNFDHQDPDSFVTVFLGIADPEHHVLTYASAGHEPVILVPTNGAAYMLPPTGPLVGVFKEGHDLFHQRLVNLEPRGATLIVTTDGITEARCPPDNAFFFEHPMMDVIEENRSLSAHDQAHGLLEAASIFCRMQHHDDIAIVTARFI
jgi:sigma-B regulation protein RsbU (phosphoserine phosphatase)